MNIQEKVIINKRKLVGKVKIPPSKSMAHRAVICASLSKGTSIIENIDLSDDIIATIEGMKALGAKIDIKGDKLIICGEDTFSKKEAKIDCNESGSTLRFLVPISLIKNNKVNFKGKGNLGKRPLDIYYDIFDNQKISYKYKKDKLDLNIEGRLNGGEFKVKGNISSQFISGILFTLPLLKEDSKIIITAELESKGYVDLTLSMLKRFGIIIENKDYKEFNIKGNQKYINTNYKVEGDYSQAAFFLCAGALGSDVICEGLDFNSLQGDREVIDILKKMGCNFVDKKEGVKIIVNDLKGTIIDASECPDIIPVLTVVCTLAKGESKIINAKRLRIKECDRLKAISTELNKLGANIKELDDGLIINGVKSLKGNEVYSHKDHRIAMSLAIASLKCDGELIIKEPSCVRKSYPNFWNDLSNLGGND